MLKKYPMCKLALSVSSALLLSACGGGSDDSSSSSSGVNAYSYTSLDVCADTDLDGACSTYEQQISDTSNYSQMINDNGAILTAHAGSKMVSPFTTLVHSEMLFNPTLKGEQEGAVAYLQKVLGDIVSVDFTHVDTTHGPKEQTEVLLKSLRQAQSQGELDPMLNIAHALDIMIANQTLDLSGFDLRTQPNRHVSFDGLLTIHGSQVDSSLLGAKSITYNPANNKIVFLDSSDNVKQIDIGNTNSAVSQSAQSYSALNAISRYDDDDDDDDDDDHHGGSIEDLLGLQPGEHQLVQILPALNSIQSYKLYQPKLVAQSSTHCNSTGTSGIFLTSLHDKSTQAVRASKVKIDAYGGASGSVPIPKPKPKPVNPDANLAAQRCFNDNFNWMMPLYQKDSIIAELDDGIYGQDKLRRLNSKDLSMGSQSYTLSTTQDFVTASLDESELLVVDSGVGGTKDATLLDSTSLAQKSTVGVNNAVAGAFTINNNLIFGLKDNHATWVAKTPAATERKKTLLDANIRFVKSSPNGKQSAIVTDTSLYLLDNASYSIIDQFSIAGTTVKDLRMLNDKAVTILSNSVEYFQFGKISGPKLKVAAQLITDDLKDDWANTPSAHWKATNMGFLLEATGVESAAASQFNSINVSWLPTGVTQASNVTGVNISGLDRGTWVTLYKAL
ncbi:hypothetical protein [Vibrio sp. TBV020]|uniref:hypothetical protein n=1 Tax=Vibrio sp. TBV020 TaxID=3137398 RepID=UPI0038CD8D63